MYLIKKVSEISGVSVRTLHHYDEIGLLSPKKEENGYRYYSEEDMSKLQTILFYKYLGFPLKDIKEILTSKEEDILPQLKNQLALLKSEKNKLLTLIKTLEKTIQSKEGGPTMSVEEKFEGFKYEDGKKYEKEAIEKYDKDVMKESKGRQKGKENEMMDDLNNIFKEFAANKEKGVPVNAKENFHLAENLYQHIRRYSFDSSLEVFGSIAKGYVEDIRFKNNIDKFGEGTAQYVSDAVIDYVNKKL